MQLIEALTVITAAATPPKVIAEYVGRLNTGGSTLSISHMISPHGWKEPGQTPEFDEYTVVLRGARCVETRTLGIEVRAGQAILAPKGDWGAIFDTTRGWGGVCRDLSAGVFAGDCT